MISPECPYVNNYKLRLNPIWHRMLYSCTHMATVGVEGLTKSLSCTLRPILLPFVYELQALIVSANVTYYDRK